MIYGTPYKGSKNSIAEWVVSNLPRAGHFYDLFAGGCAVTHAAMLSGKFEDCTANDIEGGPRLFLDAIEGKFKDETRWISREDFKQLRDVEPYIKYCWSFGNNGREYLYSKTIEPWKKALHYARVFHDTSLLAAFGIHSDGSRKDIKEHGKEYKEAYIRWYLGQADMTDAEINELMKQTKASIKKTETELREYLVGALKASGLTPADVNRRLGSFMARHYFCSSQWAFPTQEKYEKMQAFMPALSIPYIEIVGLYNLRKSLERLQSLQRLQRLQSLQRLQRLQSLQRLESLQSLESLERLQRLEGPEWRLRIAKLDYQRVPIFQNSVIYCDIPYQNTDPYSKAFDHERFFNWCERQKELTVISEYQMPEDRFICIAEKFKRCQYSASNNSRKTVEKLFIPKHQEELYRRMMEGSGVND